ncbi:hypothetical protein BD410DRAFT_785285, partial [Rickenella mellea]
MPYYPSAVGYPPTSYDDLYVPVSSASSMVGVPLGPTYFEDDYWMVPRHINAYPSNVQSLVTVRPSSPALTAALVPLPLSPYVHPHASPPGTPPESPRLALMTIPQVAPTVVYNSPVVPVVCDKWWDGDYGYDWGYHHHHVRVNPFLDGEAAHVDLILNLAASTLHPLIPSPHTSIMSYRIHPVRVHPINLEQPATYPPLTHMIIRCDALSPFSSHWDIHVDGGGRHISIECLLRQIHTSLRTPVSHSEWAWLTHGRSNEVNAAFHRRCREVHWLGCGANMERNHGVRRVDFLGERHYFAGLVKWHHGGPEYFKLCVAEKPRNL